MFYRSAKTSARVSRSDLPSVQELACAVFDSPEILFAFFWFTAQAGHSNEVLSNAAGLRPFDDWRLAPTGRVENESY
jgi:hypothetical protein